MPKGVEPVGDTAKKTECRNTIIYADTVVVRCRNRFGFEGYACFPAVQNADCFADAVHRYLIGAYMDCFAAADCSFGFADRALDIAPWLDFRPA